jgi:adenylate cyclase class 2
MMEVEAKIPLSAEQLAALTSRLGEPTGRHNQRDVYLLTAGLPVALRIRQDDDQAWVTCKSGFAQVNGIKVREEVEPSIRPEEVPAWLRVFELLGLPRGLEVIKHRVEYTLSDGVHVLLDEVEGLGTFAEVEALAEDGEAAVAKLEAAIAKLGLAGCPRVADSYRELLAKARGLA